MDMIYPIKIERMTLAYEQGRSAKEYHIVQINMANGRSVVITRWGRKGSWGQMLAAPFDKFEGACHFADEKRRDKQNKGYRVTSSGAVDCVDEYKFRSVLGPQYVTNIGPDILKFILGDEVDTTGVRMRENPEFEQTADGRWVRKEKPLNTIKDPEPTLEEQVSRNPLWGMF